VRTVDEQVGGAQDRVVEVEALGESEGVESFLVGLDDDPVTRAVAILGLLADRIAAVETAINRAAGPPHLMANSVARHAASHFVWISRSLVRVCR
jgi:hypothetical protein